MRIRKQLKSYPHYHALYPSPPPPPQLRPPPDLVSTTHDQRPDLSLNITIRPPFHSQEQHDQYPISQSVCDDSTKKYSLTPRYFVSQDDKSNFYPLKDDHQLSLINQSPMNVMRSKINTSIFSNQNPEISLGEEEEEERTSEEKRGPITSISDIQSSFSGSTTSAETSAASSVSSSLSGHGSWCEEEKVFPLKKRRISLEKFITQECSTKDKARQRKKGVKTRINNNCQVRTTKTGKIKIWGNNETEHKKKIIEEENLMSCNKRNGKGWRCDKRRVEGNLLCKHHINMLKVQQYRPKNSQNCRPRNGSSSTAAGRIETRVQKCWDLEDQDHDDGGGGKCFGGAGKKRKKVMMSSLLDRTAPLLATADTP